MFESLWRASNFVQLESKKIRNPLLALLQPLYNDYDSKISNGKTDPMKNLRTAFFKKHNRLISLLLSILGFSAAGVFNGCAYGTPVENGVPNASFIVKGTVSSENNSSVIPHIKVVMGYDSTYTDESGNYQVEHLDLPQDQSYLLKFVDIDGSVNGEYQALEMTVEFKDPQFTGASDSWYSGRTEKVVNVNLKPK